ncbi:hypothetical protein IV203_015898 [Nitzschia inconspicua]|uniref:Uncharacterized protein n=1 Tax=Nitzschia inconspicua TaxID=303405 RepID=A0A9K3PW26_9STRA|nr:hypothetical protein IV203_015898 [Nitzschia inconspicua]
MVLHPTSLLLSSNQQQQQQQIVCSSMQHKFRLQSQLQHHHHSIVNTDDVATALIPNNPFYDSLMTTTTSPFSFFVVADGGGGDVTDILRTVALAVTAILFLVAGITYLTAAILIPAGAQQLEVECQQFIPQTWNEYQQKLDDGQSIQDRPDLMFELGLLLNKAKADQLEQICQQTDNMDLWDQYQTKLQQSDPNQLLQDRPDLIQQLSMELGDRAVEKIKNNCPPDLWTLYENKLQPGQTMAQRQDLLLQLVEEPQYQQLFQATQGKGVMEMDTMTSTATTPTTPISPTSKSQWDDDDNTDKCQTV